LDEDDPHQETGHRTAQGPRRELSPDELRPAGAARTDRGNGGRILSRKATGIRPPTATRARAVAWSKDDPFGAEFAAVQLGEQTIGARGVAIGSEPEPYRLEYALETAGSFLTTRVTVNATGDGWGRSLDLRRTENEWIAEVEWHGRESGLPAPGGDLGALNDALDPDLGLSPLFNSMPLLRHGLHKGGSAEDFLMVWISVPDLSLHASPQRYTHLDSSEGINLVRFEATGEGEDFVADVQFDDDGLVLDYPGIATRLPASTA
jgi:hypothetical protein